MKKFGIIMLSIIMCFFFSACDFEEEPKKEQVEEASKEITQEETFGLNESAVFNDLKFTATEIKESGGGDFFMPEEGNVFVGIKFEIENISNEEQNVSSLLLFEAYSDDIKCEYSINAACAFNDGNLDGSIAPGKKLVGWYAVEVFKNWSKLELNVQSNWLSKTNATFVFEK